MRTPLLIALVTLLTATQTLAKVASVQFSNLVANCELIVVATVESVSSPPRRQAIREGKSDRGVEGYEHCDGGVPCLAHLDM